MFWNVVNMSDPYLWSVSRCWPSEAAEVTLSVNRNREYSTSWMWKNTIKLGRIARTARMTMKHHEMCLSQSRQKNTVAKNQQHRTSRTSTLFCFLGISQFLVSAVSEFPRIASNDSSSGSARSYRCGPCSKAFLFTQSFCQRRKRSDAEKLSRQGYHWLRPETSKYIRISKHQTSNMKKHQIKLLNSQVFKCHHQCHHGLYKTYPHFASEFQDVSGQVSSWKAPHLLSVVKNTRHKKRHKKRPWRARCE